MSHPLEIRNLVKTYPARGKQGVVEAVRNVSFDIKPGEILGLLGPNGAGKTSIISMITTLEKPSSGQVLVFGENVNSNPLFTKKQMGVVQQELVQQGFFSLEEILKFQSGYYGIVRNKDRIDYLLHRLSLYEHRKKLVKQLSGGMKRRMMIAKALVHNPKLLLLDEPTAGVDIELRTSLWDFVRDLQKEGMSILLTTHYMEEAEEMCGRVGILNKGELKYVEPTSEIIAELTHCHVEVRLKQSTTEMKKSPYFRSEDQGILRFAIPSKMKVGELFGELGIRAEEILDLKTRQGSLEEAFVTLLRKENLP